MEEQKLRIQTSPARELCALRQGRVTEAFPVSLRGRAAGQGAQSTRLQTQTSTWAIGSLLANLLPLPPRRSPPSSPGNSPPLRPCEEKEPTLPSLLCAPCASEITNARVTVTSAASARNRFGVRQLDKAQRRALSAPQPFLAPLSPASSALPSSSLLTAPAPFPSRGLLEHCPLPALSSHGCAPPGRAVAQV